MLVAPACCGPEPLPPTVELPAPPLPPGRPPNRTPLFLSRAEAWTDGPGPDGHALTLDDETTLPAVDLDDLLADRAEWQRYAEALERAGRWRR